MEREELPVIQRFIRLLAERSEALGQQAGVGGMETAGSLISYLATHPKDLEPFINGGFIELPMDWHVRGCLTYHAKNDTIMHPSAQRRARIISRLKKPTTPNAGAEHG